MATERIVSRPGRDLGGTIRVPGDKSISHRALMLGAIADGRSHISGFLAGEDCLATMAALRALGAHIEENDDNIVIEGVGLQGLRAPESPLDLGNSGTGMRLLAGLLAGQPFASELTGDASLLSRPMERVAQPLREMGARVDTRDGCAPLCIRGAGLRPITYRTPVASAQLKSAILLAGLYASGTTTVIEPGVTRDHTERMLRMFGVPVTVSGASVSVTGPARLTATDVQVPGDLSSAAFALGTGCLSANGSVTIESVGVNPTRTGFLDILRLMGARLEMNARSTLGDEPVADVTAHPASLRGATIPADLIPLAIDELPLVFALAACADGVTVIRGAEELRHKESDRIALMVSGLQALGIDAEELPDGARIAGGVPRGGTVATGGDHRIAMAFSVLAVCADGPVTIVDTANIATSFPGFVPVMQSLGIDMEHDA